MPTYEVNWHHAMVCEYLDKFVSGETKRLMVFMPPRYGKSELVSRRLPAFILGNNPDAPIIAASYGADLARRMNRDVQRIIDDERYSRLFPETRLSSANVRTVTQGTWLRNTDMFEVVEYNGYYRGAGVGGAITGMGMLYGIIDDPIKNRAEAESETIRENVWDWYTSTFRTRLAPGGAILVTVTRWHEDDLAGRLLSLARSEPKADQWTVITLPAIAEAPDSIYDIREPGEPLWPTRYDLNDLDTTRISVGEYDWGSLYQQRPGPVGGGIFRHEWWDPVTGRNRYRLDDTAVINRVLARWQFWDTAMKDDESNDYAVCSTFELWPDYRIALRSVWMERILSAFLPDKMDEMARQWNKDGKLRGVVVEDKGSGTTAIQTLRATSPSWLAEMVFEFMPTGTKEYRARQASIWCGRDCIQFPYPHADALWYLDTIDAEQGQLFRFPNTAHDDFVDTMSMGIIFLEHYISEGFHARLGVTNGA